MVLITFQRTILGGYHRWQLSELSRTVYLNSDRSRGCKYFLFQNAPKVLILHLAFRNGTSAWVYYQDINSQVREIGMDDYRDDFWRDGSVGPLGLALNGTGIGVTRWLKNGGEVCAPQYSADQTNF